MASGHDPTIPQVALNNAQISMHNLVWFRMTYWYSLMMIFRLVSMALVVNKNMFFGGCCLTDETTKLSQCCFKFRSAFSTFAAYFGSKLMRGMGKRRAC